MRRTIHRFALVVIAIVSVTLAALCGAGTVLAQPCTGGTAPVITVNNFSNCPVILCITMAAPAPPVLCSPVIPPGGTVPVPGPVGGNITGVQSLGGNNYGWFANPLAPPAWFAPNVTVGPAPGCCVSVFYDPTTCTISIFNSGFPPPCRP